VADYLSANRCAGRYLLTVAQGISGLSVAAMIANYEQFYKAGFSALSRLSLFAG
jgi:solute:Na+ symporter, SSS family